jgi:hypothetical protein
MTHSPLNCKNKENGKQCGEYLFEPEGVNVGAKIKVKCKKCGEVVICELTDNGWIQYLLLE